MAALTFKFRRNHKIDFSKMKDGKVRVGWFPGIRYDNGLSVAQVARWNEYGAIAGGRYVIPSRPFMRPVAHGKRTDIVNTGRVLFKQGLRNGYTTEQIMGQWGEYILELIQQQIDATLLPKNSDVTLRGGWLRTASGVPFHVDKKRGTHPLINTGFMRDSIDYQVEVNFK